MWQYYTECQLFAMHFTGDWQCSDTQERKDVCPHGLYLVLEEVNNRSIIYYVNKIMNGLWLEV